MHCHNDMNLKKIYVGTLALSASKNFVTTNTLNIIAIKYQTRCTDDTSLIRTLLFFMMASGTCVSLEICSYIRRINTTISLMHGNNLSRM